MFETATTALDWLGVIAFTLTGVLAASRNQMDVVGFIVLGTVTGIGGGSLRDLLLGVPVFWVEEPAYLVTCVTVSVIGFFTAHIPQSRYTWLLRLDAVGLAVFAVAGAEKAADLGAVEVVAIAMGMITATCGGVVRDLLAGETPVILTREVYASAALAGAIGFLAAEAADLPREVAIGLGFALALLIRGLALRHGWSLPRYRTRPGRKHDGSS